MTAIACCLPAGVDSKALLSENINKAAEAAEAAAAAAAPTSADGTPAPVPAFNPADSAYNELARRLSASAPMRKVQELQEAVSQQEQQLAGEAKEVRAGVPIACVSLPFNLLDTSAAATLLDLCRQHDIKVFATGPTAHGLISESFIGTAAPDTAAGALPGCDNLAAGLDMVARYGGWGRFQELLNTLKGVADKHGTSVQVVALAWLQQQGVVPLLPAHWGPGQAASSSAPWALSLGLQHHWMEPPPAITTPAAGEVVAASDVVTEPKAAAGADEAEGTEEAPAAEAEAATEGSDAAAVQVEAAAAAAPPMAAVASKARRWVDGLGALLGPEDLDVLDAHVGRLLVSSAAA